MHRPTEAAHRVAAIERARQQHILRADQDALAFGAHIPRIAHIAAHQSVNGKATPDVKSRSQVFDCAFGYASCLLYKRSHRQTINKSSTDRCRLAQSAPQPRAEYGICFACPGRHIDKRRKRRVQRQSALVVEWPIPKSYLKEVIKI